MTTAPTTTTTLTDDDLRAWHAHMAALKARPIPIDLDPVLVAAKRQEGA